ncbi:MAG: hypothetical protein ACXIU7_03975 [Roseinatronobacter sp.]
MGPIQSFAELRDFLRRRISFILLGLGLGTLLGVYMALVSSPVYQSIAILSTRVDAVAEDALRGPTTGNAARLMQLIEQRLTSREAMLRLADRYELFVERPAHERVELMRESITLISQAAVTVGFGSDGSLASMIIMARADTAQRAADMANELADMVLIESGAGRLARAQQTLEFLEAEQERIVEELRAVQAEARVLSIENSAYLSFNAEVRVTQLGQLVADIQDARREIVTLETELESLTRQNMLQRRQASLTDQIAARKSELARMEAQQEDFAPFFQRVAEVERELAILAERETRLQDRVGEMSRQVAAAEAALRLEAGERTAAFEVMERAEASQYPVSRARRTTAMMGVVAGLMLGAIVAFAYELMRPALRSIGQIERELGMRPVLVLPALVSPSERRRNWVGWFAGLILLGLSLAAMVTALSGS